MNNMNPVVYGLIVAIIGIAVVFIMLTILICFVGLMGKVFQAATKKKADKSAAAAAAAAPAPAPAPAPVVEEPAAEEPAVDDAQLIAVIAAALAAFDGGNKRLVVRKVRRVSGWQEAARNESLYHF